jgi:myosin heavy subunit
MLVAAVGGLMVERVPDWMGQGRSSTFLQEQRASQQAMQEQFSRLEERMSRLADNQEVVMSTAKSGQDQLVQLSRQFDTIAQTQQKLSAQVVTTQEELQTVKGSVSDEVQNGVRVALTKAETDQQLMRQELQSVKSVNETLIKQVGLLEGKNRELHARLALATMEMAKAATQSKSTAVARSEAPKETAPQAQVAEARRETDPQAFMFWVSFQDGTPEKSIEDLIQEINGIKKGPMNSGWYPVEVTLPKPEPPDRFLESIKRAKIVKAVATSKVIPPAQ